MVIVPLGGGGLVSGIACAIDALAPHVKVVAVQAAVCAPFLAAHAGGQARRTVARRADAGGRDRREAAERHHRRA